MILWKWRETDCVMLPNYATHLRCQHHLRSPDATQAYRHRISRLRLTIKQQVLLWRPARRAKLGRAAAVRLRADGEHQGGARAGGQRRGVPGYFLVDRSQQRCGERVILSAITPVETIRSVNFRWVCVPSLSWQIKWLAVI